jgi:hypothetical protein
MKNKLKISELAVSSFITTSADSQAAKGGSADIDANANTTVDVQLPTNPVIGCDPRESIVTNCACSGMYASLNMPCSTLDIPC